MEQQAFILKIMYIFIGLCGILFHVYTKVREQRRKAGLGDEGASFIDFSNYIKQNQLATTFSLLAFLIVLGIWEYEGLEFMGWSKGWLNGSIIFVGYAGQSILKTIMKSKSDKLPDEAKKDE